MIFFLSGVYFYCFSFRGSILCINLVKGYFNFFGFNDWVRDEYVIKLELLVFIFEIFVGFVKKVDDFCYGIDLNLGR